MTPSTIFLAIITLCLVCLVGVLIPTLLQIMKTAKKVEQTLEHVDKELDPLIASVTETAEELQVLVASINDRVEQTSTLFNEIAEAGHILVATTNILKKKVTPSLIHIASLSAGIKTFTKFFVK